MCKNLKENEGEMKQTGMQLVPLMVHCLGQLQVICQHWIVTVDCQENQARFEEFYMKRKDQRMKPGQEQVRAVPVD